MDSTEKDAKLTKITEVYKTEFIETAFARRYQSIIVESRLKKQWTIMGAYSRNGKSWCIIDLFTNQERTKDLSGKTVMPIIAVRSPDNINANELLFSMCSSIGITGGTKPSVLRPWLINSIVDFGIEQIIIDDAHELSINHFKFIKWLTDTLELEKGYYLSIILSSIIDANSITVSRKIQQYRQEGWMNQFYERFAAFRQVYGLSIDEVAEVLLGLEEIYKPFLPQIQIAMYVTNIFSWLTNTQVDVHQTGRVAMHHITTLVYESAIVAYVENNMKDIPLDLLLHIYKIHFLHRDKVQSIEEQPIYKPSRGKTEIEVV